MYACVYVTCGPHRIWTWFIHLPVRVSVCESVMPFMCKIQIETREKPKATTERTTYKQKGSLTCYTFIANLDLVEHVWLNVPHLNEMKNEEWKRSSEWKRIEHDNLERSQKIHSVFFYGCQIETRQENELQQLIGACFIFEFLQLPHILLNLCKFSTINIIIIIIKQFTRRQIPRWYIG